MIKNLFAKLTMATTYYSDCGWFGWGKEEADLENICVSGASYCGEKALFGTRG